MTLSVRGAAFAAEVTAFVWPWWHRKVVGHVLHSLMSVGAVYLLALGRQAASFPGSTKARR
ncbi:MAG TPA: hypothetical protein VFQ44_25240 [Streptosporangiaceae bacterium]|nr:hypothetical protein [Streptosporangiaceae bacterium]